MQNQELALEGIVKDVEDAGGCSHCIVSMSSDEAGVKLSLDTEALLLSHQRRSRWPVERVRSFLKMLKIDRERIMI